MFQPRWLQALRSLRLEIWLTLPLLGLVFWVIGGLITEQMLSRSYKTPAKLQVEPVRAKMPLPPLRRMLSIQVEINENQGFSQVKVQTLTRALKEQEFMLSYHRL